MNSINIVWEEPEPVERPGGKSQFSDDIKAMLIARPGKSICFKNVPLSRAKNWKQTHEGFAFETRTKGRGYDKNRCDLYAKYVGDAK